MTAGTARHTGLRLRSLRLVLVVILLVSPAPSRAQTMATLQGRVFDDSGAVLAGATITVRDPSTGFGVAVQSAADGRYFVTALPAGTYSLRVEMSGFRPAAIEELVVDVDRTIVRDFHLGVGDRTETVTVRAEVPLVDRATTTVGAVVALPTIQDIPLNGRHFIDLSLVVPGSVAPSQSGFSSRPLRGVGALAFNIAGNREEAVSFVVNGVSTNNLTFGSLIFEPPLGSIQEFKVDSSAFAAEYGHVSGAIVNIATRSGTDTFRGDAFEYFRNDAFDARNFFEFNRSRPAPFNRHQFGGSAGGPLWRGRTFFFVTYEGFRQRQEVDLNSLVLSDAQRAAVTDPIVRGLLPLIPRANYFDASGTARFVGSSPADVDNDRWTADLRHSFGGHDRVQAYYGHQALDSNEPGASGNSIPGFGIVLHPLASVLTANETHVFGATAFNEIRFGRSVLVGGTYPAAPLNPADFAIQDGVTGAIGLPQMIVAGDLNFGGPGPQPQGRTDTSYIVNDMFSHSSGHHSIKLGGEYRHFINDNFAQGTGVFNFPTVGAFMTGVANAFNTTLGLRRSTIDQRAMSLFVQDRVSVSDAVTLDLGLRYEWHVTPTERDNRFIVFDPQTAALVRVGVDTAGGIYRQNNLNLEPRIGVVWALTADARTVVRAAYGTAADEPGTTAVRDTAGNPPFGIPLTASGAVALATALTTTRPAGLAPATVDPAFRNASLQSWNVNVQRQLAADAALTIGYLGSRGANLRISRNINQPIDGVRPFASVSAASPISAGSPLGVITQVESSGFSTYHGLWIALTRRLAHGLQFDTSYTLSKAMDTNSLNSSGFAIQDAYNIANEYGLSDFDARHRFILSGSYSLPFTGHLAARGWQLATVVQAQSGNPVNIVTSGAAINGVPNTVRPDLVGPIRIIGSVDQWFDPSAFAAVPRFGNLGRNAVIGPGFFNTDVLVTKSFRPRQRFGTEFRVAVFDAFNHANFGPPGNIVGTPTFGKITRTRLPTGEAGSSRQIQLSARMSF